MICCLSNIKIIILNISDKTNRWLLSLQRYDYNFPTINWGWDDFAKEKAGRLFVKIYALSIPMI